MKKIFFILLMLRHIWLSAQSVISAGGTYIVSEELEVAPGRAHALSAGLNYSGSAEAQVGIFLLAYDASLRGDILELMASESAVLAEIVRIGISEAGLHPFGMNVEFDSASRLRAVLILDAALPEGASLSIDGIKLLPLEDALVSDADSGANAPSGALQAGESRADSASGAPAEGSASAGGNSAPPSESGASIGVSQLQFASSAGIVVYVNSSDGDDSSSGESRARAKRSIAAALSVSGVTQVNLAGGQAAHIAPLIRPAPGTTLVIKPEGTAVIKGQ